MVPQPEKTEKVACDGSEEAPPPPDAAKRGANKQHGQDQGENLALLPEEFQFLKSPECNPNLKDPKVRKIGCMRQANTLQYVSSSAVTRDLTGRSRRCTMFRQITGCIVLAWPVQFVMMIVILVDCTVAIMSLVSDTLEDPSDEGRVFLRVLDIIVVCMLTIDVCGRFFFEGWIFLRSKLNLLELLLVPITIAEVWFLQEMNAPVPLLRALRPILRGVRIFRILVRTAGKGANYLAYLRKQVSGERVRFVQDGFDLDLAYISAQIIAMSLPGAGYERLLHNPYTDVACFLNERHGNKYLLVNVTQERRYPLKPFFGRYYQFGIPYQGVPRIQELWTVCEHIDDFLKVSPEHVVAIHSHHGQGRVSMMVIALLLYRGTCPSVTACIAHVEHNRTNPNSEQESTTQTLDNASQRRFMEYFGQRCRSQPNGNGDEGKQEARLVRLRRIALHGCSNQSRMDVKCFLPSSDTVEEGDTEAGASTPSSKPSMRELKTEKPDKENAKSLVDRVTTIINESTLDSVQAGCKPMRGRPFWSSADESAGEMTMTLKRSASNMSSYLDPARWETSADSMRFSGEFCLEFHRRSATQGKVIMRQSQQEKVKHQGRRCLRCCCCKQKDARKSTQDKLAQVHSGMLFGCWLHSDFLELDESQDNPSTKRHVVTVELDRFNLDKASNAPTMRSYSSVLKVQLEFEVERRIEWVAAEEEEELAEHLLPIQPTANMSESYTLEWLTWVSKRVWPSFTSGFESLLRNNLMPSLKESMPGPLKSIRLAQCSFGTAFPQFGPINACSRNVDGLEVQLDIQLNYSTATNIVLDAGLVSFGISHLKISGVLSLRFKPILSELPVFSAMQLLFLNLPEVDLRFARNLEIANSSRVRNIVFGSINKGLCDLMVLPNIININWADPSDDGSVSFRNVLPCAILRLKVMEARDLYMESRLFKTAPDTFIKVQLGAQVAQTPTISKNSCPVWGKEFDFLVYDEQQHLTATAMDVDYSGRTHSIGSINRLPVLSVVGAGNDGKWLPLSSAGGGGNKPRGGGDILIAGTMFELIPNREELERLCPSAYSRLSPSKSRPNNERPTADGGADVEDPEEPEEPDEEQDQDQEQDPDLNVEREFRSGSAALLVCEVFGGVCPADLAAVSSLDVKVSIGKADGKQRCVEAQAVDPGSVSEKSRQRLERLAALGLDAASIAESLGEDIVDVQRIMRRRGWNLELPQKINILLTESDLSTATTLDVSVCLKKKHLAGVHIPLSRIVEAPSCKHTEVITCRSDKHRHKVELDAEFRLFYLQARTEA